MRVATDGLELLLFILKTVAADHHIVKLSVEISIALQVTCQPARWHTICIVADCTVVSGYRSRSARDPLQ